MKNNKINKEKKQPRKDVGRDLSTNLPGLFAAGDITGRPYQYAKAAGEGCVAAHSVKNAGKEVMLTDTEYAILEHLLKNRGSTVTAKDMYEAVWKEKFLSGSGNTVMVHVLNLRRKIETDPSNPKIIRTVWGKGYQID